MTTGEAIREQRKACGMTQQALADKVGMHQSYLTRLECNKYTPTITTLNKLAHALGVSIDRLQPPVTALKHYTLTIVFNTTRTKVLMCWHTKQNAYNFIGGTIEPSETSMDASYRELFEETGISSENITLQVVREGIVKGNPSLYSWDWDMLITYGILKGSVMLKDEKNRLVWLDVDDKRIDKYSTGYGNCRVFLNEALAIIKACDNTCN